MSIGPDELDDVVDDAGQSAGGFISDVVERIDFLTRNRDTLMGVPTGFTLLDRILGGLQKSDLIILCLNQLCGHRILPWSQERGTRPQLS